jgi:hypothetical protein
MQDDDLAFQGEADDGNANGDMDNETLGDDKEVSNRSSAALDTVCTNGFRALTSDTHISW